MRIYNTLRTAKKGRVWLIFGRHRVGKFANPEELLWVSRLDDPESVAEARVSQYSKLMPADLTKVA